MPFRYCSIRSDCRSNWYSSGQPFSARRIRSIASAENASVPECPTDLMDFSEFR